MGAVKWIKINVDMFDDEKIKVIQSMPEGDALLLIWIKLIVLAGKVNDAGYVYIAENFPYTEDMLSTVIGKPVAIVKLALHTFSTLGMIENDTKGIYLVNFEKYQSLDRLTEIREYNKAAQRKLRAKKKEFPQKKECVNDMSKSVNDMSMTCQRCHETEEDIEREGDIEREEEKEIKNDTKEKKTKKENGVSEKIAEAEFAELWKLYPNKQEQKRAMAAYIRARTRDKNPCTPEQVKAGIVNYIAHIKKTKAEKYVKMGGTYFFNECWEDVYEDATSGYDEYTSQYLV